MFKFKHTALHEREALHDFSSMLERIRLEQRNRAKRVAPAPNSSHDPLLIEFTNSLRFRLQ